MSKEQHPPNPHLDWLAIRDGIACKIDDFLAKVSLGWDMSSSDDQHDAVTEFADELVVYIIERGWEPPHFVAAPADLRPSHPELSDVRKPQRSLTKECPLCQGWEQHGGPCRKCNGLGVVRTDLPPGMYQTQLTAAQTKGPTLTTTGLPFPNHPGSEGPPDKPWLAETCTGCGCNLTLGHSHMPGCPEVP